MNKRKFVATVLGSIAALVISASAQAQVLGKEYSQVSPPQPTDNQTKIEVLEFFSYGCIHCYRFNSTVSKWAAKLPADVEFKRIPVAFNRTPALNLSRLFYALEAIGELGRLDEAVFAAIFDKNVKLHDESTMKAWVAQEGVDAKKFADAYASFGVQSKAKRADQMGAAYKIEGTPTIAVDGRYLVLTEGVKSYEDILVRADKLIGKVRSEKKK